MRKSPYPFTTREGKFMLRFNVIVPVIVSNRHATPERTEFCKHLFIVFHREDLIAIRKNHIVYTIKRLANTCVPETVAYIECAPATTLFRIITLLIWRLHIQNV